MQEIEQLHARIIDCNACERLRSWCSHVSEVKKKQYLDWEYWGKPVPGFGDPNARLVIVGLAPGAHGANRTGRVFTGDASGDWLYGVLHAFGFANQPASFAKDDGLVLTDAYITNIVHCAPPENKPESREIAACRPFLEEELILLQHAKVILVLGQVAFKTYLKILASQGKAVQGLSFKHGALYKIDDTGPLMLVSYHPSRQNTNTGVLTRQTWFDIFQRAKELIDTSF